MPEATLSPESLVRSQFTLSTTGVKVLIQWPETVNIFTVDPSGMRSKLIFPLCRSLRQGFGKTRTPEKSDITTFRDFDALTVLFACRLSWIRTVSRYLPAV